MKPLFCTSCFKSIINKAPRLATILSTLRTSLNGLSNPADVKPYTEFIAVFKPFAKSPELISPSFTLCMKGVSLPSSILLTSSQASCLILTRPSTISLKALVYLIPNNTSAIRL